MEGTSLRAEAGEERSGLVEAPERDRRARVRRAMRSRVTPRSRSASSRDEAGARAWTRSRPARWNKNARRARARRASPVRRRFGSALHPRAALFASLRSIFFRAAMAFRFRFADGFS